MSDEMRIWRSDDLGALIRDYTDASWQTVGAAVLEVLHETIDAEELAEMTPEELVHLGFAPSSGHLIIALPACEVRLDLIPTNGRVRKRRRPRDRRPHSARED